VEERKNNAFENCKTPQELYGVIEKVLCPSKDLQSRKSVKLDQTRHYGTFFDRDQQYYGQDGRLFDKLTLEEVQLPPEPVPIYEDARMCALTFRKLCPTLPILPPHNNNAVAGLQEMAEWCIDAMDVVHNMVLRLDVAIIEETIGLLVKLRELPASCFPTIDERLWNKAKERAQRIVDKYRASTSKRKACRGPLSPSYYRRTRFLYAAEIISSLAELAGRKADDSTIRLYPPADNSIEADQLSKQIDEGLTQLRFYKAVGKIYRMMDKTYADGLVKLEQNIGKIIDRVNQLDSTQTGKLLNTYDKLSGLKLQDRFDRIGRAYSIDSVVESTLFGVDANGWFGGESKESLVDTVVATLKEISQAARTDLTPKKPAEADQKATPAKRGKIITWIKGLAKEFYGLTIERITKAYLDKYG